MTAHVSPVITHAFAWAFLAQWAISGLTGTVLPTITRGSVRVLLAVTGVELVLLVLLCVSYGW